MIIRGGGNDHIFDKVVARNPRGKVRALACLEVVRASEAKGPAAVVRAHSLIRRGEEMTRRQRRPLARIARRLMQRLSTPRY